MPQVCPGPRVPTPAVDVWVGGSQAEPRCMHWHPSMDMQVLAGTAVDLWLQGSLAEGRFSHAQPAVAASGCRQRDAGPAVPHVSLMHALICTCIRLQLYQPGRNVEWQDKKLQLFECGSARPAGGWGGRAEAGAAAAPGRHAEARTRLQRIRGARLNGQGSRRRLPRPLCMRLAGQPGSSPSRAHAPRSASFSPSWRRKGAPASAGREYTASLAPMWAGERQRRLEAAGSGPAARWTRQSGPGPPNALHGRPQSARAPAPGPCRLPGPPWRGTGPGRRRWTPQRAARPLAHGPLRRRRCRPPPAAARPPARCCLQGTGGKHAEQPDLQHPEVPEEVAGQGCHLVQPARPQGAPARR